MTATPGDTPVITPVKVPTVAALENVYQAPPATASLSVDDAPTQIELLPLIGRGNGSMVTTLVAKQPDESM